MAQSSNLKEASAFLQLLFKASNLQARALLETMDTKQIRAVREIIFNILNETIPLTEHEQDLVDKRRKILQRIIRLKGYKSSDVTARHHRVVYKTLCMVKEHILPLL